MAKVKITGHASGSGVITVTAPNTSTNRTITLPDATATIATTAATDALTTRVNAGGRRNIIINGGMAVAQRGTSTTSGAKVYLLDRFYTYQFNASGRTVSQSTDSPSEFSHSLKVQRAANNTATTDVYLSQPIESKNCVGTAGKKITFSFWAKKGANWSRPSSIFPVSVTSGTGTDQSFMAGVTGGVTLINSSATLTTSWAKYSFTSSAIVPTNSTQLIYQTISGWAGTAGADDSFYITGIQLETGETATEFEHRSYGEELALCQRYYWALAGGTVPIGQIGYGGYTLSNYLNINGGNFPVTMRGNPSFVITNGTNYWAIYRRDANDKFDTLAASTISPSTFSFVGTGNVSGTQADPGTVSADSASAKIHFSAEL